MANEQYAFLRRSELPTTRQLQDVIDADPDFTLIIDPKANLSESVGFVPCVICGVESGVEIDFDDSAETIEQFADLAAGRDCCLVFRWGGDAIECACAMVLSYALSKYYSAIVSYEGEPAYASSDVLRDEAIAILNEAELELT